MAHIYRLICACVLACVSISAFASFPANVRYSGQWRTSGVVTAATPALTCAGIAQTMAVTCSGAVTPILVSSSSVSQCGFSAQNCQWTDTAALNTVTDCGGNATLSGNTCTCVAPAVENASHTGCNLPAGKCDWANGQTILVFGTFYIERSKPMCNSGCQFVLKADAGVATESKRLSATSPWWDLRTMGDFVGTNLECSGLEQAKTGAPVSTGVAPPNTLPPLDVCPSGKVGGTVNGVFVCVPPGETTGSGSGTKETVNPEGEKTKEVVTQGTVCVATTCTITTTTTTTVTTSSGVVGTPTVKTTSETVGRGDYCKTHTTEVACGGSGAGTGDNGDGVDGTFSASCGTAPACTGDAVQCAQAEWAFKAACALTVKPADNAESSAYATALAGAAGDKTADLPGNSTVNISSGSFDQTEFLGAASGLSDLNIVVMGRAVTLKFSTLNVWLSRLGVILQAVTFLLCIRIVTRG